MIYQTTVTKMGPSAKNFLAENMIILFKDNAPEELAEFCVLHDENKLSGEVQVGDTITISKQAFRITAVGEAVAKNLQSLGHITIKADGAAEPELPGTLSVEKGTFPSIEAGHVITITR